MRMRPGPGLNSLIWLLWHMARTEDAAVNPVVAGRDQVLDDEWMRRMNVPWRIIGTGMTDDEVTEMTARADIASVRAYRSAVGLRTREVVGTLRPEAWDEIVGVEDIRRAAAAGAFRDWVEGTTYPWLGLDPRRSTRQLSTPPQRRAHRRSGHNPRSGRFRPWHLRVRTSWVSCFQACYSASPGPRRLLPPSNVAYRKIDVQDAATGRVVPCCSLVSDPRRARSSPPDRVPFGMSGCLRCYVG
mgnify:CR=1 FL=1